MGTVTTVPQLKSMLANENVKSRFKEILGKKAPGFISSIVAVANSIHCFKRRSRNLL